MAHARWMTHCQCQSLRHARQWTHQCRRLYTATETVHGVPPRSSLQKRPTLNTGLRDRTPIELPLPRHKDRVRHLPLPFPRSTWLTLLQAAEPLPSTNSRTRAAQPANVTLLTGGVPALCDAVIQKDPSRIESLWSAMLAEVSQPEPSQQMQRAFAGAASVLIRNGMASRVVDAIESLRLQASHQIATQHCMTAVARHHFIDCDKLSNQALDLAQLVHERQHKSLLATRNLLYQLAWNRQVDRLIELAHQVCIHPQLVHSTLCTIMIATVHLQQSCQKLKSAKQIDASQPKIINSIVRIVDIVFATHINRKMITTAQSIDLLLRSPWCNSVPRFHSVIKLAQRDSLATHPGVIEGIVATSCALREFAFATSFLHSLVPYGGRFSLRESIDDESNNRHYLPAMSPVALRKTRREHRRTLQKQQLSTSNLIAGQKWRMSDVPFNHLICQLASVGQLHRLTWVWSLMRLNWMEPSAAAVTAVVRVASNGNKLKLAWQAFNVGQQIATGRQLVRLWQTFLHGAAGMQNSTWHSVMSNLQTAMEQRKLSVHQYLQVMYAVPLRMSFVGRLSEVLSLLTRTTVNSDLLLKCAQAMQSQAGWNSGLLPLLLLHWQHRIPLADHHVSELATMGKRFTLNSLVKQNTVSVPDKLGQHVTCLNKLIAGYGVDVAIQKMQHLPAFCGSVGDE